MRRDNRRALLGLMLVMIALVAIGFWYTSIRPPMIQAPQPVGTGGIVDVEKAREGGARLGEKLATATNKVSETAQEAAITAKVKAKMALDDHVKARRIDVTTDGATVTIEGKVESVAEHDRAVALARETDGVANVVDRLTIRVP